MRLARLSLVVAATLLITPALAPPAVAQETSTPAGVDVPKFSVFPAGPQDSRRPRFEYRLQPTQSLTDVVSVANLGDVPLEVSLYAADAVNTADGGFSLEEQGVAATDVGAWVQLASDTQVVQPGTQVDVPFELVVPADASPGDHVGGIVAQAAPVTSDVVGSDVGVDVIQRVGARLYLTVDGPMAPHLDVESITLDRSGGIDPTSGTAKVTYTVRNSGNVRLSGAASVELTGAFGIDIASSPKVDVPELLPGSRMEFEAEFDDVPAAVRVTAAVRLDATSDRADVAAPAAIVRSAQAWAVPWVVVAVVVVGAGLLVAARRRRRSVRRRQQERAQDAVSVTAKPRREMVDA